ncbi:hypothetical protein B296_00042977 [Ensete ventricosum]|uniref:Uncharacterized protein n=1 Tax=Ensete ventricosum TaxID=4639 RepID=A0A426XL29_ENSVE|nr:hypothetical protein B296_00042977 [Ensete ventricosum]
MTVGLGRELTIKLSLNSFARGSKNEMEDSLSRLYQIQVGPLRVSEKPDTSKSRRCHREPSGLEMSQCAPTGRYFCHSVPRPRVKN